MGGAGLFSVKGWGTHFSARENENTGNALNDISYCDMCITITATLSVGQWKSTTPTPYRSNGKENRGDWTHRFFGISIKTIRKTVWFWNFYIFFARKITIVVTIPLYKFWIHFENISQGWSRFFNFFGSKKPLKIRFFTRSVTS